MRQKPKLVVMLKEPRAGRVKTRLGRDIGTIPATWWFRRQVKKLLRQVVDSRWSVELAVSPDNRVATRAFPRQFPRRPQGGGDLGDRMGRILRTCPGPVIVIGGDIPGITCDHIARAFRALGAQDAVIGSADDGGFWMIGWNGRKALPGGLFDGVRWSTEYALSDTLRNLSDYRVALVDQLSDVDTGADLAKQRSVST